MDELDKRVMALIDWATDERGRPDEKRIKEFLKLPLDDTDSNVDLIMEHDWRELKQEEKEELAMHPSFYTDEFRKCKNCGLTVVPGDGIKEGHGYCDGIIVEDIMDE